MSKALHTIHIVAGPTASGKSARALELAKEKNGIVINCDSMQIYDGLPILTAQPVVEDIKTAPHALYSALQPNEKCSAGIWRDMAVNEIEKAIASNHTPIIVGGTGLYIKALTEGLSPIPPVPPEIRAQTEKTLFELGNEKFYQELKRRDSTTAAKISPNDTQRIVRAWEVLEATGRSLADWQEEDKLAPPPHWQFQTELIMPEREELYRRCNTRFLQMLENGVLEEIKQFQARIDNGDINPDTPLTHALGYKPLLRYIKNEIKKEEAITHAQVQTRQYAKRQMTWFRNQL